VRWIRPVDARWASALLTNAFEVGSRRAIARVRFAAKVILVPHLTSRSCDALVGLEAFPRPPIWFRLSKGVRWATRESWSGAQFADLPSILAGSDQWRVFNLARPEAARPAATVALARTVMALADCHRVALVVDVPDPRFHAMYERHGFRLVEPSRTTFVREPQTLTDSR
jgi:hypothetical protein